MPELTLYMDKYASNLLRTQTVQTLTSPSAVARHPGEIDIVILVYEGLDVTVASGGEWGAGGCQADFIHLEGNGQRVALGRSCAAQTYLRRSCSSLMTLARSSAAAAVSSPRLNTRSTLNPGQPVTAQKPHIPQETRGARQLGHQQNT